MPFGKAFRAIAKGLTKTRDALTGKLAGILRGRTIDQEVLDELEETLIAADVGVRVAGELVEEIAESFRGKKIDDPTEIEAFLADHLAALLDAEVQGLAKAPSPPTIVTIVGMNGSGKTTTAAKLAGLLKADDNKVLLAAADTFRAAAGEQLQMWADRAGVEIVGHGAGGDPAAVVFDAVEAAIARGTDYVLVDTAGRMQTADNLMRELAKIHRVVTKKVPDGPHEVLLVLDATTGQNAISQARLFRQAAGVTGIVLSKLDGTARGGVVLAIQKELAIPVKFIGTGESIEDIAVFDPPTFAKALLSG